MKAPVTPPPSQIRPPTPSPSQKSEKIENKKRETAAKRPAAALKSRSVLKRPSTKLKDGEKEAPPMKRPSAFLEDEMETEHDEENMDTHEEKKTDSTLPVLVEKPKKEKTHARSANVLWEKRYPSGWIVSEIQTSSGRKYKKYSSPRGYDCFSKTMAVKDGFEDH